LSNNNCESSERDERVRIVGHPFDPIGMGQLVRSVWHSLTDAGVNPLMIDIWENPSVPDREYADSLGSAITKELGTRLNIFCINGDQVAPTLEKLRDRRLFSRGSHNVIYPAWELERYPAEWAKQLSHFNEVWAMSKFTQQSISKVVDIPVIHMPLACEVKHRALRSRRNFGIRDSAYVFLFAFDFLSYVERKNPFAVVEAFRLLITVRPFDDLVLVIKTNNSDRQTEMKKRFDAAIAPLRDRIIVIDNILTDLEMKSLMWLCDSFVSLHRSEGFGFGPAEAMALAKPVIATAYSGNMEYCNRETALLVPFTLIPLRSGEYPHWQGQHWADPDVDSATHYMRKLVDNPGWGRKLGQSARAYITKKLSYLAVGQLYLSRIRNLLAENG
jgi:glycosyltransferase involved in cell wall biosynthesis